MREAVRGVLVFTTVMAAAGYARAEEPRPELPVLETSLADDGGSGSAELWLASARSVAGMWATYIEQFRDGTKPMLIYEPRRDCYLRIECAGWFDDAIDALKLTARGAFRTCLDYARVLRYWDENAEACEAWLAAHYRGEFHRLDELRPAAHWTRPPRLIRQPPATYGAEH